MLKHRGRAARYRACHLPALPTSQHPGEIMRQTSRHNSHSDRYVGSFYWTVTMLLTLGSARSQGECLPMSYRASKDSERPVPAITTSQSEPFKDSIMKQAGSSGIAPKDSARYQRGGMARARSESSKAALMPRIRWIGSKGTSSSEFPGATHALVSVF